jgi:hypothetical protein
MELYDSFNTQIQPGDLLYWWSKDRGKVFGGLGIVNKELTKVNNLDLNVLLSTRVCKTVKKENN